MIHGAEPPPLTASERHPIHMSGSPQPSPSWLRPLPLTVLAVGGVAALLAWFWFPHNAPTPARIAATPSAPVAPVAVSPPAAPVVSSTAGPRFDIARIAPDGNAVIAGQAKPGAQVTILDGGQPIGQAQADQRGAFVFLPTTPLAAGTRELRLTERAPDGTQTQGTEEVVLIVPPRTTGPTQSAPPQSAFAVLTAPNTAPRLLQAPVPATDPASPPGARPTTAPGKLGLDIVDYDASGEIRFSGTAPAGSTLRMYVDNQPIGTATADAAGRWSFQSPGRVPAGEHQLRLDQLAASGQVTTRVELPFRRESLPTLQAASRPIESSGRAATNGQIIVQPGDSLWLLARHSYGEGLRYTAIHAANRGNIRYPNLIYPGQILIVPPTSGVSGAAATGSSTSTSSNRSR